MSKDGNIILTDILTLPTFDTFFFPTLNGYIVFLVVLVLPELKQEVLKLGAQSENEEVREVVEDFQNL